MGIELCEDANLNILINKLHDKESDCPRFVHVFGLTIKLVFSHQIIQYGNR